jgi:hypothetical protein
MRVTEVLSGEAQPRLWRLGSELVVSALEHTEAERKGTIFWVAERDRLVPHSEMKWPWEPNGELATMSGDWPDKVYALAWGSELDGFHTKVLRRGADGWKGVDTSGQVHHIEWTGSMLVGTGRARGTATESLRLIVGVGSLPTIPAGSGPQCDAFYASGGKGFDKLAVHPQALGSIGGELFAMGMGCHAGLAMARWKKASAPAEVVQIQEPHFWGTDGGRIFGRSADRAWYMRFAMRPSAKALLLQHTDAGWQKTELPSEDADLTGADVDAGGALWAVFDNTLYRREQGKWVPRDLAECRAEQVSCLDDGSVWVTCEGSVLRISGAFNTSARRP